MTAAIRMALEPCFVERPDCGHGTWDAMTGDHFGEHLTAALASMESSGLHDWLLAHEHHTLYFGREHGHVAGAITCASLHNDGDPHVQRFPLDTEVPA